MSNKIRQHDDGMSAKLFLLERATNMKIPRNKI